MLPSAIDFDVGLLTFKNSVLTLGSHMLPNLVFCLVRDDVEELEKKEDHPSKLRNLGV